MREARAGSRRARALHVTRAARQRLGLPAARFGLYGRVLELDPAAAYAWAARLGGGASGAELVAAVALHELMHALIEAYPGPTGDRPFRRAWARLEGAVGPDAARGLLAGLERAFEPADPTVEAAGEPLEELLLLELAHRNPALGALRQLFVAPELTGGGAYAAAVAAIEHELGAGGGAAARQHGAGLPDGGRRAQRVDARAPEATSSGLLRLLLAPQERAPASLLEQLREALRHWRPYLDERHPRAVRRALRASDLLAEALTRGGHAPGPPPPPDPAAALAAAEPVAFTPDAAWMPGVVLVAKSVFVWLAQLSARFGHQVERLDQVPDEALAELAERGFNALWLVGVWQRSLASRTIKRLRGQPEAEASAYSVYDYRVAPELGGDAALERLAARAAAHGLRLACDMVPNHTAIDARWVVEHPERYLQLEAPPYPSYAFSGPDLSSDPRVQLRLEDGYYDGSDAAVVFERVDAATGERRYLYHGNDGTGLPWNDTAQLDFLREDVRHAVIDVTVAVARRFPIIRLDAAMTLARRHVRRLWHPAPGEGGAVPSRAAHALDEREFARRMPREFWRELVERLAAEAPGTMLLAEAFWLMEVYFVRSLGMNRVYNSAFMHMTAAEENAAHRAYLKRYLALEPRVLERFVNYMSNPDEEPVAVRYGDGDKAFGVAVLMAALPGLPLFAHGQVEGLREKYGMEYARPRLDEAPREDHVERHQRQVAPLLARRELFAGAERFRLFDLEGAAGVVEDAFVVVNGRGAERTLVAYNNGPRAVAGRVRRSAPFRAGDALREEDLASALGVQARPGQVVALRASDGATLRAPADEVARDGLWLELGPYEARAFLEVRLEPAVAAEAAAPQGERGGAGQGSWRRARRRGAGALLAGPRGSAARRRARRRRG